MSRVLQGLESRGFIDRVREAADLRRSRIEVLPAGTRATRVPVTFDREAVRATLHELDQRQRATFLRALDAASRELSNRRPPRRLSARRRRETGAPA